ncbi:MAG: hypothetical protein ICV64_00470 [Thermoleophilia bacterium]|nr:hypothetical protein [Thermoleophilia bacterium]
MSTWDDRFREHPVHQALDRLDAGLDGAKQHDAAALEAVTRLRRVADHVRGALAAVDPQLVSAHFLNELHSRIEGVASEVEYANEQEDAGLLQDADAQADALLDVATRVQRPADLSDVERIQEAATSFRRSVGQLLRSVEDSVGEIKQRVGQLRGEVDALTSQIEQQKGRIDSAIATYDEQFRQGEEQRRQEFETTRDEAIGQIQDVVTASRKEVDAARRSREEKVRKELDDARSEMDAIVDELRTHVMERHDDFEEASAERTARLEKLKADAERLVGVIAVTGLTGGYQQVADREKKDADQWRWIAVGSLGFVVAFNTVLLALDLAGIRQETFSWEHLPLRIFISLAALALAAFAGNESRKHRAAERDNRDMEVQLAALNPYLALFDDDEQREIKKEKFDRFFRGFNAAARDEDASG